MFPMVFITVIFLHIAFALALAYFVLYLADKAEGRLKSLGTFIGWLLIILAILSAIATPILAAKQHHRMHERMKHEFMMHHGYPMMQQQQMPEHGKRTGGACPIEVK